MTIFGVELVFGLPFDEGRGNVPRCEGIGSFKAWNEMPGLQDDLCLLPSGSCDLCRFFRGEDAVSMHKGRVGEKMARRPG